MDGREPTAVNALWRAGADLGVHVVRRASVGARRKRLATTPLIRPLILAFGRGTPLRSIVAHMATSRDAPAAAGVTAPATVSGQEVLVLTREIRAEAKSAPAITVRPSDTFLLSASSVNSVAAIATATAAAELCASMGEGEPGVSWKRQDRGRAARTRWLAG